MNYFRVYEQLISRPEISKREKLAPSNPNYTYYEKHHIIPKCMGGSDHTRNLVLLTAREHFLAHWLLHRMHPDNDKLAMAFSRCRSASSSLKPNNSKLYKYAKEALAFANSHRIWTKAARDKIAESNRTRVCTDKTRVLRSLNMIGNKNTLGRKLSVEHKKKLSDWSKNMPAEAREKQKKSYELRKSQTKICEYCGKEVNMFSYSRAHGARCKLNPDCIRTKHEFKCEYCGKSFSVFSSSARFCSEKCRRLYHGVK